MPRLASTNVAKVAKMTAQAVTSTMGSLLGVVGGLGLNTGKIRANYDIVK